MSPGQRVLAHKVLEAMQILSRVSLQARKGILFVQAKACKCIQRSEAKSREEHFRAQYPDGSSES